MTTPVTPTRGTAGPVRQVRPKTEGWNQKLDTEGRPLLQFASGEPEAPR